MRQYIQENYDLSGTAQLTLKTDTQRGFIRINSIDITSNTPGVVDPNNWSGIYFKGIPIKLTAVPLPGYKFTEWKEIGSSDPEVTLELDEDLILTAVFSNPQ